MAQLSDKDRVFRNRVLILIGVIVFAYLCFKSWHISVALEVWSDQQLPGDTTGSAR